MKKVRFVCSGNTRRSPMAEWLFKKLICDKGVNDSYEVYSCGIYAENGDVATNEAYITMKTLYDIDISSHRAQTIEKNKLLEMDLIFCMTYSHKDVICELFPKIKHKVYTLNEYVNKATPIFDPYGCGIDEYIKCAKQIENYLISFLEMEELK